MKEGLAFKPKFVLKKYRADIEKYRLPRWKVWLSRLMGKRSCVYDLERFERENPPYEVLEHDTNIVTNLGAQAMLRIFVGLGTSSAPSANNRAAFFSASNSYIGVGNGTATPSPQDTNLVGTQRYFKAMDAGYPQPPSFDPTGSRQCVWVAVFGTTEANFEWREVGLANADLNSNPNGILFNRAIVNWGTKTPNDTWTVSLVIRVQ